MYAVSLLAYALTASALPLGQLLPDLPQQADLSTAQTYVNKAVTTLSGTHDGNKDYYGEWLNKYVPVSTTTDQLIGADNVLAIDVLADRACIAAADQGSLCNELLSYAYAWYAMQQKSQTYKQAATILGPNNMKIFANDLKVLCLSQNSQVSGQEQYEVCQLIAFDIDNIANSVIGVSNEGNDPEDAGNNNSLEHFGLAGLLPTPSTILP